MIHTHPAKQQDSGAHRKGSPPLLELFLCRNSKEGHKPPWTPCQDSLTTDWRHSWPSPSAPASREPCPPPPAPPGLSQAPAHLQAARSHVMVSGAHRTLFTLYYSSPSCWLLFCDSLGMLYSMQWTILQTPQGGGWGMKGGEAAQGCSCPASPSTCLPLLPDAHSASLVGMGGATQR